MRGASAVSRVGRSEVEVLSASDQIEERTRRAHGDIDPAFDRFEVAAISGDDGISACSNGDLNEGRIVRVGELEGKRATYGILGERNPIQELRYEAVIESEFRAGEHFLVLADDPLVYDQIDFAGNAKVEYLRGGSCLAQQR